MKAWKIDLSVYEVPAELTGTGQQRPYDVRKSLRTVLVSPMLRLNGVRLLEHSELATKIGTHPADELLVDAADYKRLTAAFEKLEGLGGADVEFVRRVLKAPEVEVEGPATAPAEAPTVLPAMTEEELAEAIRTGHSEA